MILLLIGEVYGKTSVKTFRFRAYKDVRKLDFVTVKGDDEQWVLCQIDSVESYPDGKIMAVTKVIGYRDGSSLKVPKIPVKPSSLVYSADKEVIEEILKLEKDGLYLGLLESNNDVSVYINPKDLISRHIGVLASTGSGKSYTVGIIIEELLEKKIPVLIIDPHGEYTSLRFENDNSKEIEEMKKFNVKPKAYKVEEYSPDPKINPGAKQLSFKDTNLTTLEISQILPTKPTASQLGVLYMALKELKEKGDYSLEDLMNTVVNSESPSRWNVINMLEMVRDVGIFSKIPTRIKDLIKGGQATVINLRGVPPDIQGVVVYKLIKEIFEERKIGKIPPLFLVVEEAHNFIPEKEIVTSSKIIKTVASEGRKFGLGLAVISQRPARISKDVLSQCNTQIILRITNPNDLKAVSYAEGLTDGVEKEIKNLTAGTALIIGHEFPLFVNMRVRKTKHGGETISVDEQPEKEEILSFKALKKEDLESRVGKLKKIYYPCWRILSDKPYLFDGVKGNLLFIEGERTKEQDITAEPDIKSFNPEPVYVEIDGEVLKPQITKEQILKKVDSVLKNIQVIELVYYPYFVSKNLMIDGITGMQNELKP